jgi:Catalytic LigB subunit of aromatic ring-opening dioxygenase
MAEILGLGVTHYPGLMAPDEQMAAILERTLSSAQVPAELKDPARWPAPMQEEYRANRDLSVTREHRRRCLAAFGKVRAQLDAFKPDFVLIWGDDQYENFREDGVPAFCVFALDEIDSRPYQRRSFWKPGNIWDEPIDKVFHAKGHQVAGSFIAAELLRQGFDLSYAYKMRYELGLPHAFINVLLLLDAERHGFPYPVVPFHVNCYGSSVLAKRGTAAHLDGLNLGQVDPPSPSPGRCFEIGAATARILKQSPWRVAVMASSSWSHAFLSENNHCLYPNVDADRARVEELRAGRFARWRDLTTKQVETAGQHEFLNWVCLAGAMSELGHKAEIVDYVETYILNSNKCFAVFHPA